MPVVARGVVDEHVERNRPVRVRHGRAQGRDVAQVATAEARAGRGCGQGLPRRAVDVEEHHAGSLAGEGADHLGADARRAPGDQDAASFEGTIADGVEGSGCHGVTILGVTILGRTIKAGRSWNRRPVKERAVRA